MKKMKKDGENKKLKEIGMKIIPVLKRHGVTKAGIFGSYSTGENKKRSDIDILVEFKGSLIDLIGLEMELEEVLGKKVDLLTYKGISPYLKKSIIADEVKII